MIDCVRHHLFNKKIRMLTRLTDLMAALNAYSWKVRSDGTIDSTSPEHGIKWDAPSNIVDSAEYLIFGTLGMPEPVKKQAVQTEEIEHNFTQEYKKNIYTRGARSY